jgi:hypothetical protein
MKSNSETSVKTLAGERGAQGAMLAHASRLRRMGAASTAGACGTMEA